MSDLPPPKSKIGKKPSGDSTKRETRSKQKPPSAESEIPSSSKNPILQTFNNLSKAVAKRLSTSPPKQNLQHQDSKIEIEDSDSEQKGDEYVDCAGEIELIQNQPPPTAPVSSSSDDSSDESESEDNKMADFSIMPKFTGPLYERSVRLFFQQYKLWVSQQKLTENAAKASLPLAFQCDDARHWCFINADKASDATVSLKTFCDDFLSEAPVIRSSPADVFKVLTEIPKQSELASAYLLRARYQIGDAWTENEGEYTQILICNLPKPLATYLLTRRVVADNFKDLLKEVRKYEKMGNDSSTANNIKQEVSTWSTSSDSAQNQSLSDMQSLVQVLLKEVADIKSVTSTSGYRGRGRGGSNFTRGSQTSSQRQIHCYYCNKPNHVARECFTRLRELGQIQQRGRGNRGRGYRVFRNQTPQYTQYPPQYIPATPALPSMWNQQPALQYQPPPYVTFPPESRHQGN